jgi:hypothetical protein
MWPMSCEMNVTTDPNISWLPALTRMVTKNEGTHAKEVAQPICQIILVHIVASHLLQQRVQRVVHLIP